jgi:hypothetical protein
VPFSNIQLINNIFYTITAPALKFSHGQSSVPDVRTADIRNNIFYQQSGPGLAMLVCNDGGTQSQSYCNNYRNYTFDQMQQTYSNIRNNSRGDPRFVNFDSSLHLRQPWLADLDIQQQSAAIDLALPEYSPEVDLKGRNRLPAPDAGAYEFLSPTLVRLNDLTPRTIQNGIEQTVRLEGENFAPGAAVIVVAELFGRVVAPQNLVTYINVNTMELVISKNIPAGEHTISVRNPNSEESNSITLIVLQDQGLSPVFQVFPQVISFGEASNITLLGANLPVVGDFYNIKIRYNVGQWFTLLPDFTQLINAQMLKITIPVGLPKGFYDVKLITVHGEVYGSFMVSDPVSRNTSVGSTSGSSTTVERKVDVE